MMQRILLVFVFVFSSIAFGTSAIASADGGCYPEWKLGSASTCGSIAILSPANDTRANMILLLADRVPVTRTFTYPETDWYEGQGENFFRWSTLSASLYPKPEEEKDRSDFYGSRCQTYNAASEIFAKQMVAAKVKLEEREALNDARTSVFSICADPDTGGYSHYYFSDEQKALANRKWVDPSEKIASSKGKEFLTYLLGAKAFYEGDYQTALESFAKLTKSGNPWLKETAIYMIGRTEINRGQSSAFGKWGDFKGPEAVGQSALANAEKVLKAYIKNFPNGRYVNSASGFMRRIYWLSGDTQGLVGEYEKLIARPGQIDPGEFAAEADTKLFFEKEARRYISDPLILAVINLEQMREGYGDQPTLKLAELENQRQAFAQNKPLFEYLLASHAFHVSGNAREVLTLIPDAARQESFSYLQFSRQVLRGLALAKLNDRNEEGFWRDMLSGAKQPYQRPVVELGLARSLEEKGQVEKVFAPGSPIQNRTIREILLQHSVGAELLRRTARDGSRPAHERDVALFTLLYKQLVNGDYAGYSRDAKLLPSDPPEDTYLHMLHAVEKVPLNVFNSDRTMDEYICPKFSQTTAALAKDNEDVSARLCLGDFIRLNGFDYFGLDYQQPDKGELGSGPSSFNGGKLGRQHIYTDIIANPGAKPDDKAYALYRAVYCYARTGNNGCGGKAVPESQRKTWFRQLKNSYPNSEWAKKLKYYW